MVAFNLKSNETTAQMEVGNQKHFDGGNSRERREDYCYCSLSAMEYITSISGCNKWDLLLGFMICSGLLIFADGYTAIKAENIVDYDHHHSSVRSDRDGLLHQAQQMCRYQDRFYTRGTFQVAPCIWCECTQEGNTKCRAETCSQMDDPECIKYEKMDRECCPVCVEYGCKYNGISYKRGSSILTHDVCRKCYCPWEGEYGGEAVCLDLLCPSLNCVDPHKPAGKCCPVCPNGKMLPNNSFFSSKNQLFCSY